MLHNLLIHKGELLSDNDRKLLPQQFPNPFSYIPDSLCREAALSVQHYLQSQTQWHDELQAGKMFGVLVVETSGGELGYLAAFSGNLQGKNNHEFFVPPVYDLLNPDNFFKVGERKISNLNREISILEQDPSLIALQDGITAVKEKFEKEILQLKKIYMEGKAAREEHRKLGLSGEMLAQAVRESQFQKAEIKRAEKRFKEELIPLEQDLAGHFERIDALKKLRKEMSASLQEEIFENFTFLNAHGEKKSLLSIFTDYYNGAESTPHQELHCKKQVVLPPGGAGECAAPKLLQYAYLNGMRPITMGEFWWGNSPKGEIRRHGEFYPSCKGKCAPILGFMLQGLNLLPAAHNCCPNSQTPSANNLTGTSIHVIYEDEWIIAVDKPSGILSVPGKEKDLLSVQDMLGGYSLKADSFGGNILESIYYPVHRLDMHTSGVLILAKNVAAYRKLQHLFASREVEKTYVAVLTKNVTPGSTGSAVTWTSPATGEISLPLAADYVNRPCQRVDYETGKEALTKFEIIKGESRECSDAGHTYIKFFPLTGRTHQLRVHSAHPLGLNSPIEGDLLYGVPAGRLMLHAESVKFIHPFTQKPVEIIAPIPEEFIQIL